jgi:Ni/Fe-hydrogenase subunit HybB-like protein
MGYAIVIFEASVTTKRFKLPDETHLLGKVSVIMAYLIGAYLIVRFTDVAIRGHLGLAFKGDLLGSMFLLENLLLVVPMCFLFMPAYRSRPRVLFLSSVSIVLAGALYRFNCFLIAFNPGEGWIYFPATGEIVITLGIVSLEIMAFLLFIKRLPIYRKA